MIDTFKGDYFFLSNFYQCDITHDGFKFSSVEAAFQASKVKNFQDMKQFEDLNPSEAKKLGRHVLLRDDWENVKLNIMFELCFQKFSRSSFRDKLINTKDELLIEGNTWNDIYWGKCNGKGENHLGLILMDIRKLINT